jgi:hypothetical protein
MPNAAAAPFSTVGNDPPTIPVPQHHPSPTGVSS